MIYSMMISNPCQQWFTMHKEKKNKKFGLSVEIDTIFSSDMDIIFS